MHNYLYGKKDEEKFEFLLLCQIFFN